MELFPQNMFFFFFRMGKSAVIFEMKTQLRTPSCPSKPNGSFPTLMETDIQTILKGHELPPLLKFSRRTRKKDRKKEGTKEWDNAFSHVNKVYWSKILSFIPHELNKGTLFGIDMIPKHFLDSWHFFFPGKICFGTQHWWLPSSSTAYSIHVNSVKFKTNTNKEKTSIPVFV